MQEYRDFQNMIRSHGLDGLRSGLIGRDMAFETPFGTQQLLYADFTASGRALRQVEEFIAESVLPIYANTHTEASYCGQEMGRLREGARAEIARITAAGPDCSVIFTGAGATSGLNRLVALLDIPERLRAGKKVVVMTGPYEHHSNILPWRESGAEVIEIPEAETGGPDLTALEVALQDAQGADLKIGTFSAASNVSGILTDPDAVTRLLKRYGALSFWDYAGGGPYLPLDMEGDGAPKDAIALSPHKFAGGPGASGLLILRNAVVDRTTPTAPGGGTVSFVSPWAHDYLDSIVAREEAGTPNLVGDIRAALALLVKEAAGEEHIAERDAALRQQALEAWSDLPNLRLLGRSNAPALPIFSLLVLGEDGAPIHHQIVSKILSDRFGVQARAGCACAGPYGHRLMGVDEALSERLRARVRAGDEWEKPGWTRLGLHFLHDEREVDRILEAVAEVSRNGSLWAADYGVEDHSARYLDRDVA
ncbi:aminotransferase class V-fold PLP-dependent enzyme [Tropicimonas sp. IMCC6043]|uniref:aminotransferase class V-fold PLP-dependent enzyme n=1 Tax=Tropicimonas sp. IMCC6043 TaxID=2510645 RepID=UPI00101CDDDA|nr:aminotransferase class V-fold PLP-dependent enzyme [Tropicimonas sp. IMCC6043]RYH11357.1 aminotransferase class V-fold PLP-dependent enzyme [Tropicimonas sp. IMCC6043]